MIYKFYDTCSLLIKGKEAFTEDDVQVVVSSITLSELEEIKSSRHKDDEIKYQARQVLSCLNYYPNEIHIFKESMLDRITDFDVNNDIKILATALDYDCAIHPDETIFVTNDRALALIANLYFGEDSIESVQQTKDEYKGFKDICLTNEELGKFYENISTNHFNLLTNEYLILRDEAGELVDRLCWTGATHRAIKFGQFDSMHFGKIKPMKNDVYQALAIDSLLTNKITMICGPAGSGKTTIALAYLFSLLEKEQIDRIVIFCNPVVAKDAAKLGYYPGSKLEKLMGSQVGAVLSSKLGSDLEVESLVGSGQLSLVPVGDARGYEVPENSGVYVMEAQNLTKDLLRLILQRISESCKVIVDGDYKEQVDLEAYAGSNNGMTKMSEVFRGYDIYGQVELQQIHRSQIAQIADKMK